MLRWGREIEDKWAGARRDGRWSDLSTSSRIVPLEDGHQPPVCPRRPTGESVRAEIHDDSTAIRVKLQ